MFWKFDLGACTCGKRVGCIITQYLEMRWVKVVIVLENVVHASKHDHVEWLLGLSIVRL